MKIVIVDYNVGNINSVFFALQRLGVNAIVSDDASVITSADKVILPGVGTANFAMQSLCKKGLDKVIINLTKPVLGICLGMQLLCEHSEENDTPCLGVFKHKVKRFSGALKVPQMGWNTINNLIGPLFENLDESAYQYFVHSYYVGLNSQTIATTNYLIDYSAALQFENFYGVQFHPEKSSKPGSLILKNFINL